MEKENKSKLVDHAVLSLSKYLTVINTQHNINLNKNLK